MVARGAVCFLALLGSVALQASAFEETMSERDNQQCRGMYSRKAVGGAIDPYIEVLVSRKDGSKEQIGLAVLEYRDLNKFGVEIDGRTIYYCDDSAVMLGACAADRMGEYIIVARDDASDLTIKTQQVPLSAPTALRYPVNETGFYCIFLNSLSPETDYTALINWRNSYGELNAAEYPKLPFYGGLAIIYTLVAIVWGYLYYRHQQDILPIQNYLSFFVVYLVIENIVVWEYYHYVNRHGLDVTGSKVLLVLVGILNAGCNSYSFFMLLLVCLGYSVVKQSLGNDMWKIRALAIVHFIFGVLASIMSHQTADPNDVSPWILLIVLPLAITMTMFYLWILSGLNATISDLVERKQMVKAKMYMRLWRLIIWSVLCVSAFFFLNSFDMATKTQEDYVRSWKYKWFMIDGWLNIAYFSVFITVIVLWRPTANNRRFAMSEEIGQEDEFEIGDLEHGSNVEARGTEAGAGSESPPPYERSKKAAQQDDSRHRQQFQPGTMSDSGDADFVEWVEEDEENNDER